MREQIEGAEIIDLATMLSQHFSKLKIAEKAAVSMEKLEQEYILHLDSQPCTKCGVSSKIAISSAQNTVRLFNQANLAYIATIKAHSKIVTGVRFSPENPELLYSSSRDGTVKCWDLRNKLEKACQEFNTQGQLQREENMFTAFDISCDGLRICAGTDANKDGDSHLIFWDTRQPNELKLFSECHTQDITGVRFHPQVAHSMISAATDGLVNLFDLNEAEEDDAILTSFNTESSASKLGWCGKTMEQVFCTTHTETLHIWDSKEFSDILNMTDLREEFDKEPVVIEYLVDCVMNSDGDMPLLLAGSHSGLLHLLSLEDEKAHHIASLSGGHQDDIRCINWDLQSRILLTGGDDGMLCLWNANDSAPATTESTNKKNNKAHSKNKAKPKSRGPVTAVGKPYHKNK